MDKKYWENKQITVYWWNFGEKTLDYKGTYKGFLKEKGIRVRSFLSNGGKRFHFTIPLAFTKATLDTHGDYGRCCDEAIQIFLTLMGDKAHFESPVGNHYINWK